AGKVSFWGKSLTVVAPIIEEGNTPSINTSGLVPIYPLTEGITSKFLRTKIHTILSSIKLTDPLDPQVLNSLDLIPESAAYQNIHFPQSKELRYRADKRLSFNEHLRININNQLELQNLGESISIVIKNSLTPFKLTPDQEKTVTAIYKDLKSNEFTHRLIQGDTGSGKTATIIFAANQCLGNNLSCAILAPTEILATQHFKTLQSLSLFPQQIQLITGSSKQAPKLNKPSIFIGTHSLLTSLPPKLKYPLAFVAIDEQHKFGVKQRNELLNRTPVPHLFNLSATPIPRTVALGLLGDINISNITHRPINRYFTHTLQKKSRLANGTTNQR
ncbi:MAG: ATP-dependent DNA helicase RecG, partial [Candidatus Collierbacteria bacterium GW2011_GWD2_42_50]